MSAFNNKKLPAAAFVLALSAALPAAASDAPSVEFAYAVADAATDFYGLGSSEKKAVTVACATKFDAADLAPYAGNSISRVTVYSPSDDAVNPQGDVEIFIYEESLSGQPLSGRKATLSGMQKVPNEIELTTPVKIVAGKSYYVGYRLRVPSFPFYYMPVDLSKASPERCLSMVVYEGEDAASATWDKIGADYGNLCLGLTVTGDNLPDNWAAIRSASFPPYLAPSAGGSYEIRVENLGISPITSLSVATTLPDGRVVESDALLEEPIETYATGKATVDGFSFNDDGHYRLSSVITKVNGKPARANSPVSGSVMVYEDLFRRRPVVEEAGGSWCAWCPAGLVMFDNIHTDFPDDFICISVHQGDDMDLPAYYPFLLRYFTAFPASIVNRAVTYGPADGHTEEFTRNYMRGLYERYTSYPAPADVSFTFRPTPDGKKIKVSSEVEFALDTDRQYLLSYVVTEDHIGPYSQVNGYSGGTMTMGGWEKADGRAETFYDDVARDIVGFPGIAGSLPASVEKGKKYTHSCELSLSRVTGSDWRVIALVTDAETGEIVNAAQVLSDTYVLGGVREIACGGSDKSDLSDGAVYTLDGRRVSADALAPGVYVVRKGAVSRKIMIK